MRDFFFVMKGKSFLCVFAWHIKREQTSIVAPFVNYIQRLWISWWSSSSSDLCRCTSQLHDHWRCYQSGKWQLDQKLLPWWQSCPWVVRMPDSCSPSWNHCWWQRNQTAYSSNVLYQRQWFHDGEQLSGIRTTQGKLCDQGYCLRSSCHFPDW